MHACAHWVSVRSHACVLTLHPHVHASVPRVCLCAWSPVCVCLHMCVCVCALWAWLRRGSSPRNRVVSLWKHMTMPRCGLSWPIRSLYECCDVLALSSGYPRAFVEKGQAHVARAWAPRITRALAAPPGPGSPPLGSRHQ